MKSTISLCALVCSLGISAEAQEVWPPEPFIRDREPHVMQIDADTMLCEVQWDGHKENGQILDISAEADFYVESVVIPISGEYVFISSDPVQVFGKTEVFQYFEDDVMIELTLVGHLSNTGEKRLSLVEVAHLAFDKKRINEFWGRIFCP